jgi:membrane associated rhomboid family serine protease
MRDVSGGGGAWPVCLWLIVILTGLFALQCINDVYFKQHQLEFWLAMTPDTFRSGYLWQLITFQFFHVSLWHLIGNAIGLWFIGRTVEVFLGPRRFLTVYFFSGLAGGILQATLLAIWPEHYGPVVPVVFGASAGVTGIFAVFAVLASHSEVRLYFLLPINAMVLLWIVGAIELFFTLVPSGRGGQVAHAAHLGGLLAGVAFVRLGWHQDFRPLPWEEAWQRLRGWFRKPRVGASTRRPLEKVAANRTGRWLRPAPDEEELPPGEFISREVDPILDKISQHGIHSLTDREKKILEKARERMAKR